jgi:murein peptide amidase A
MDFKILTHSPLGLPLKGYRFNNGGRKVLILGGVHGDEIEGVIATEGLLSSFTKSFAFKLDLLLVPHFNPDGVFYRTRSNSRGVDLNRNLPTKDWSPEIKTPRYHPGPIAGSEPENQWLAHYINSEAPELILSLHSWLPMLNVNGDCLREAETLSRWTGYRIDTDIGYPTPGCLGTFAGLERKSPTLTYEIERGLDAASILNTHVPAILECLKTREAL